MRPWLTLPPPRHPAGAAFLPPQRPGVIAVTAAGLLPCYKGRERKRYP